MARQQDSRTQAQAFRTGGYRLGNLKARHTAGQRFALPTADEVS